MPKKAEVSVDPFGNYRVNGQVRFMPGVCCAYNNLALNIVPTPGYPPALKWLYEDVLTYEVAQRIGFDTITVFGFPSWMKKIDPQLKLYAESPKNTAMAQRLLGNGLPISMDYTAADWGQGRLAADPRLRQRFPPEAFNSCRDGVGNNHWVPYSVFHPKGQEIYRMVWESGIDEIAGLGGQPPFLFELFNEPAYNDRSEYNKNRFAVYLQDKFGDVAAMNRLFRSRFPDFAAAASLQQIGECPPLAVAWGRFMEDGFTELNRIGRDVIRSRLPKALVCTQIIGSNYYRVLPNSHINMFAINRFMDAIATPTSGGLHLKTGFESGPARAIDAPAVNAAVGDGFLMRHLFRAMADGKPIHNPEAYGDDTGTGNGNVLWLDLLRGSSATYFFGWCRRTVEWDPPGTEEGGRRHAEKFRYVLTNPYAKTPDSLSGIQAAKQEINRFQRFFVSRERERSVTHPVALMLSYPTERFGVSAGNVEKNEITGYAAALEFAHYLPEAFFEEQLQENRAGRYRAVVAVGVRNTYPETPEKLAAYVEQGGVLVAAREIMPEDEYGNPRTNRLFAGLSLRSVPTAPAAELQLSGLSAPAGLPGPIMARNDKAVTADSTWDVLGDCDRQPGVLRKSVGRGFVYFIAPVMQDNAVAAVLGAILAPHGISPILDFRRIPQDDQALNLEIHPVKQDRLMLTFLLNFDAYPKRIAVKLPPGTTFAAELLGNQALPVRDGRACFLVPEEGRVILGFGERKELEAQFGPLRDSTETELQRQLAERENKLQTARAARAPAFSFRPDPSALVTLDLRPFVNKGFQDDQPGDGKGGWTDQGREKSLQGVPWGVQKLLGVPCDLIRFDENADKTCLVLNSSSLKEPLPGEVNGIKVDTAAAKLYFFHTCAGNPGKGVPVMTYRINYRDGGRREVAVRGQVETGNWEDVAGPDAPKQRAAWSNHDRRGFYVTEWENPEPAREIATLDVVSACGKAIPIVIGITAERFTGPKTVYRFEPLQLTGWGGCQVEKHGAASFSAVVDGKTLDWSGVRINASRKLSLNAAELGNACLKFRVGGGRDKYGNPRPGLQQPLKVEVWSDKPVKSKGWEVKSSAEDQDVAIPLAEVWPKNAGADNLNLALFQFMGVAEAGFRVDDVRIEYRKQNSKEE